MDYHQIAMSALVRKARIGDCFCAKAAGSMKFFKGSPSSLVSPQSVNVSVGTKRASLRRRLRRDAIASRAVAEMAVMK